MSASPSASVATTSRTDVPAATFSETLALGSDVKDGATLTGMGSGAASSSEPPELTIATPTPPSARPPRMSGTDKPGPAAPTARFTPRSVRTVASTITTPFEINTSLPGTTTVEPSAIVNSTEPSSRTLTFDTSPKDATSTIPVTLSCAHAFSTPRSRTADTAAIEAEPRSAMRHAENFERFKRVTELVSGE